jgi:hypothetical protein
MVHWTRREQLKQRLKTIEQATHYYFMLRWQNKGIQGKNS